MAALSSEPVPGEIARALQRLGLAGAGYLRCSRLEGGVSSDIWRVEIGDGRVVCAKRALARLRTAAEWRAPVERNIYEARWYAHARDAAPGHVPELIGQDDEAGVLVMSYLDPAMHSLWKAELMAGRVDPDFAGQVGRILATIHAWSASRPRETAPLFRTDDIFRAIRLEPYLLATAVGHPDLADRLRDLAERTADTRHALVHGDVSPKNILCGPVGPVFLDAECAWWGDPAFDLAFCLNHLMLKRVVVADAVRSLDRSFEALSREYLCRVDWEDPSALEARAATLLPALSLARVDGKSPVEYLTDAVVRGRVRETARRLFLEGAERLDDVRRGWVAGTAIP